MPIPCPRLPESQVKTKKYPTERPKELIAGGDIQWSPIDRTAAMLLAKASWIHKPPITPKYEEKNQTKHSATANEDSQGAGTNPKTDRGRKMRTVERIDHTEPFGRDTSGDGKLVRKDGPEYHRWIQEMAEAVLVELNKTPSKLTPLAKALIDARKAVEEAGEGIGLIGDEFDDKVRKIIAETRSSRLAIVTETHQIMSALKDIRVFFLGSDHEKEINRLREFVDLCERLQKLKESGFLDSVADTMLRLAT